jgi:transglutaminase-like putative cysteine protease
MRIRVAHQTLYRYEQPAVGVIQVLRLQPRDHDGQYVASWRIEVSEDCRLEPFEDHFGNFAQTLSVDGPLMEVMVRVDGEVETQDTQGVVRGSVERFPPSLYLRDTALSRVDPAIAAYALEAAGGERDDLAKLHALLRRIHTDFEFDGSPTGPATSAGEAFALRRGVCQDFAHVFLAAARRLGVPARYVGGYLLRRDGVIDQEAGHAWVEGYVPGLGWVAFDPANGVCASDLYVRVAVGLDYLDAAPVRGTRFGGGRETLEVAVRVEQARIQEQG